MAKKDRVVKNDGSYIFADFSKGLYLLDTPRGLGEQLGSLALVDGRNVWAEKGALIPQYGYEIRATLPPGYDSSGNRTMPNIMGYTQADLSSDNIAILANTLEGGLRTQSVDYARLNSLAHSTFDSSKFTIVGSPTITADGVASGFSSSNYIKTGLTSRTIVNSEIQIPINLGTTDSTTQMIICALTGSTFQLFYNGSEMVLWFGNGTSWGSPIGGWLVPQSNTNYLIKIVTSASEIKIYVNGVLAKTTSVSNFSYNLADIAILGNRTYATAYSLLGSIDLKQFSITVDGVPTFSGNQTGVDTYVVDDTSINIPYTLSSNDLKIVDSVYESSILEAVHDNIELDYYIINHAQETGKHITYSQNAYNGIVYLYSASQGLKRYATVFNGGFTNPLLARRGKDLIIYDGGVLYVFGAYYGDSSTQEVQITSQPVPFQDYSSFGIIQVSLDEGQYFWSGKEILIDDTPCTVTLVSTGRDDDYTEVRVAPFSGSFNFDVTPITVTPTEKTKMVTTLTYIPEDQQLPSTSIIPQMMAVSNNRLFIEHSNGNIYYSSIGFSFTDSNYDIINPFEEAGGAGYFGGFFNDTTRLLSIEDYFNGVLLTKENGFYYLTISVVVDENNKVKNSVQVDKISQAGQRYPSDHVIVGNDVYAYDANSGSLVKASQANVFGALVAGKTLVASEFLNVANFNINSGKRFLTYNYESQVLILYYGEDLKRGIVYSIPAEALFPRELDKVMIGYTGFNQGVIGITERGELMQDFKRGMIIPNLTCVAQFEPIGVRDNRMICSTILEVTELNGIDYDVTTQNAGSSYQQIQPSFYIQNSNEALLPFIYSEDDYLADSYQLTSRWAEISSHRTRIYAPMSGRNGVTIQLEFEADKPFCLSMLRLPDFCQGN